MKIIKEARDWQVAYMPKLSGEEMVERLIEAIEGCDFELRNFLQAFDAYFEMRGTIVSPKKADVAKRALLAAAEQARQTLATGMTE